MEKTLFKIADAFNENGIVWGLGASMLLHYKGLETAPNDIDMIVAVKDIEAAQVLLNCMGQQQSTPPNPHYKTKHFLEYTIAGKDVDIMAGFVIAHNTCDYEYILDEKTLEYIYRNNGKTRLNLCPLEDWLVLYLLMPNRQPKVDMIKLYLKESGCNTSRLAWWLKKPLPYTVKEALKTFT